MILRKKKKNTHHSYDTNTVLDGEGFEMSPTIGSCRSFSVAEAHKRLRTNVFFSFADKTEGTIIGVTSAMAQEGKSTTAVNLAYDIMQSGKKVLFIDADMRFSKIEKIVDIRCSPGLSDYLAGAEFGEELVQRSNELGGLPMISSGDVPKNPTELLSGKRMSVLLESLKASYEYIIIDLPPISAVSDALIVSGLADGIIMVVRQDYAEKNLLEDAVRQLSFIEANIIGFVMNCAHD